MGFFGGGVQFIAVHDTGGFQREFFVQLAQFIGWN
jgi:hypothetical protein